MSQSYELALVNKIIADFQKGNKKEAYEKLNKFVIENPTDENAKYNFAVMSEQIGKIDLAKKQYNEIIKKNLKHWKSKFNLYLIFIREKKYTHALNLVNEVLLIKPNYPPALRDKAVILYYLKKPDQGLPFIEKSLQQNEKDYLALNVLGLIYMEMKKYDLAIKIFKKAISLNTNYFPSYNNLGRCYQINNNFSLALENFKNALKINPLFVDAINNIANHYNQSGSYEKAIKFYRKAIELEKNKPELIYNMGLAHAYLGNYKIAEELYKKAYSVIPNDDLLKKNYSILLLANQRFQEAWGFFEGRIGLNEFRSINSQVSRVEKKLWKGQNIEKNKKILIIKEQGAGDEILYGSMYPDLLKKFQNVKIETDERLISLFERSLNKKNIFVPYSLYSINKKKLDNFDIIMYAGSLGKLFRNNLSNFPKKNYLKVDKKKYGVINNKINKITKKLKIGISWKSKNATYGADKSLDLNLLKPILSLNNFSFFNLQYGDTKKEIDLIKIKSNIEIISLEDVDLFNDFESIGSLLKNLDLFITVSNTTAHLSAALGVTTWIIKPKVHAVFHYWNQPSENTTPWYPSVRLFTFKNSWKETVNLIKKELIKKFI